MKDTIHLKPKENKRNNSKKPNLILFFKEPIAGKVKTRLGKDIGMELAKNVYCELLKRHLNLMLSMKASFKLFYFIGATPTPPFKAMFEKKFGTIHLQTGKDLGEKMWHALMHTQSSKENGATSLIIGSDTGNLEQKHLLEAKRELERHDAVIGPSDDGGYWCIGMSKQIPLKVFSGIEWSTSNVYASQKRKLLLEGSSIQSLSQLFDVDQQQECERASIKVEHSPMHIF